MSYNTEQLKRKIIEKLKTNPITSHTCKTLNIPRSSYYRWIKEDKIFYRNVRTSQMMGRAIICDAADSKLCTLMNSNDERISLKVCMYILNRLHPIYKKIQDNYINRKLKEENNELKEELKKLDRKLSEGMRLIFKLLGKNAMEDDGKHIEDENKLFNDLQKFIGESEEVIKENNKIIKKEEGKKIKVDDFV